MVWRIFNRDYNDRESWAELNICVQIFNNKVYNSTVLYYIPLLKKGEKNLYQELRTRTVVGYIIKLVSLQVTE